jgi:hypothetical protein
VPADLEKAVVALDDGAVARLPVLLFRSNPLIVLSADIKGFAAKVLWGLRNA